MISIVVAASANGVIGRNGELPWHLPADMKFFKNLTRGHPIIMGRKTFVSLKGALPDRPNIVLTHSPRLLPEGVIHSTGLEDAISKAGDDPEIFIIGGGKVYREALHSGLLDRIYLTRVDMETEGDTFFPEPDPEIWKETQRDCRTADEKNRFDYCVLVYDRIK